MDSKNTIKIHPTTKKEQTQTTRPSQPSGPWHHWPHIRRRNFVAAAPSVAPHATSQWRLLEGSGPSWWQFTALPRANPQAFFCWGGWEYPGVCIFWKKVGRQKNTCVFGVPKNEKLLYSCLYWERKSWWHLWGFSKALVVLHVFMML